MRSPLNTQPDLEEAEMLEEGKYLSPFTSSGYLYQDGASQIKVYSAIDALGPQESIEWYVENLLSAGSVNLLVGEAGSKKTWAMLDMAVCVANGDDWLGHKTKRSQVLYIDEESGPRWLKSRIRKVLIGHSVDYEIPLRFVSLNQFDLRDSKGAKDLCALITNQRAKVVIIDALADIMPGGEENSVKDVQPVFLALRNIAEKTQSAILVIHHTNKGGGYRGSTAMKGAVDLLMTVSSTVSQSKMNFKSEKARNTEPFSFSANAVFGDGVHLEPTDIAREAVNLGRAQLFILSYLVRNGPSTTTALKVHAMENDCSKESVRQAIYPLAKKGLILRIDGRGKTEEATYALTDEGVRFVKSNLSM